MYAIEVKNLTKHYILHEDNPKTLKEKVLRWGKSSNRQIQKVLSNVNIKIEEGQVVGLIGRNGSGKSTFLKLLSRIIYPSSGEIVIRGRVTSLLELGAGFHPDFTGIENIYMNASLFGLSRKEIDKKINDIIEFSELGDYVYRPVRIYSSGMYMRLAFSIATVIEPDILLIDEVLAVGDAAFQQKCLNRIMTLKEKGKTIVIVAHDQGVIERLCDYCVWLKKGEVVAEGPAKEISIQYLADMSRDENERFVKAEQEQTLEKTSISQSTTVKEQHNEGIQSDKRWGNMYAEIISVELLDESNSPKRSFNSNDGLNIQIVCKINNNACLRDIDFGIAITRNDGLLCYGSNTNIDRVIKEDLTLQQDLYTVTVFFPNLSLLPGEYYVDVATHSQSGEPYDYIKGIKTFIVFSELKDQGISRIAHSWTIQSNE